MTPPGSTLVALIDEWLPEAFLRAADEDERVRARIVLGVLGISTVAVAVAVLVMTCLSLLQLRDLWTGVAMAAIVCVLMAGTAAYFRRTARIATAANGFALLLFFSVGAAFVVTGGIHSPVAFLLLAVPVSVFMVAGRRYGVIWSLIVLTFYLAIFYAESAGVRMVQIMRPENRNTVTSGLWYLSGTIIIGFLALYERIVDGLTGALMEEKSRYRDEAIYDLQTGLLRRDAFQKVFEEILHEVSHSGGRLALLRIDLKNVRQIVAQLGYDAGDELIRMAASRLLHAAGETNPVGRFGDNEFCILVPSVSHRGDILGLIFRVQKEFKSLLQLSDGVRVPVIITMGAVLAPDFSISSRSLLRGVQDAITECDAIKEPFVMR